ncbi:Penicillin-binding protein precursor (D-alanyl-D-alanine-endopeptidase) (DD-endopeptidase) [Oxalobacteraceae bacterium IMCC9480]|nr:Penicillin-binding protein precursor (D-alanyl-D-alanine-endopeptidase) (DD-endopeptidase) [Oxalobacteraceae bacterium IMCC9480]NDP60652.1 D-alanyl-D-alanine endopeptidase [Oxalobacteraceae bacterium]
MSKSVFVILLMCSFFLSTGTAANAADKPERSASAKKHAKKSTAKKSTRRHAAAKSKHVSRNRAAIAVVPAVVSAGDLAGLNLTRDALDLKSNVALVMDQSNSKVLFEKNSNVALPIASITKLMTSMVVVESNQNMDEMIEVTSDDIDREKNSSSRLRVGSILSRSNMLHIALMSSENRAASALGRNYPGGLPAFVGAMNAKAKSLGMNDTRYVDSTGLSSHNVASAQDLAKLVIAARQHQIIGQYSTDTKYVVKPGSGALQYSNSNHLVGNPAWDIDLQKTGYINEAGRCMVMLTNIEGRPIVMVFLDSKGKQSRTADAGRIRKWIEALKPENLTNPLAAPTARNLPLVHS